MTEAVVLVTANLAATKLFSLCGISVDAGILVFPVSYILGDIIMEFYGMKTSMRIVWTSMLLDLAVTLIMVIAVLLEPFPGWDGQTAFASVFGFMPRIVIGSLAAYVASNFMNNVVFSKIREYTGDGKIPLRTLMSSAVGKFFDIAIFETIAFLGVLPIQDFLMQALFAYVFGMVLEALLNPVTCLAIKKVHKFLD